MVGTMNKNNLQKSTYYIKLLWSFGRTKQIMSKKNYNRWLKNID